MKRTLSLVLILALLLALTTLSASAMKPPYERLEAVDYSRIMPNGTLRKPVELVVGSKVFQGYIQLGRTLTNDETDAIIRQVMLDQQITSGMLIRAKYIIQKVEQNTGLDMEFVQQLGLKFAMGGTGLDNIVDIYDVLLGEKTISETAINMSLGQLISELADNAVGVLATSLKTAVTKNLVGFIVGGLFACTETAAQKAAQLMRENDEAQEALAKTFMLNAFYNECNRRLENAEFDKGGGEWSIQFNDSLTVDATLFEIPVKQQWRVVGRLLREDHYGDQSMGTNYSGIYRGDLQIEVRHDLANFDAQFINDIARKFPVINILAGAGFPTTERHVIPSKLTKLLTNASTVEVHLNTRNAINGRMSEFINLTDFTDESAFQVDHLLRQGMPHPAWDVDGHMHAAVPTELGTLIVDNDFYFEHKLDGMLTMGNRYPAVAADYMYAYGRTKTSGVVSMQFPLMDEKTPVGFPFLVDYQIFEDLRSAQAELRVLGE